MTANFAEQFGKYFNLSPGYQDCKAFVHFSILRQRQDLEIAKLIIC